MAEHFDGDEPNEMNQAYERLEAAVERAVHNGGEEVTVNLEDVQMVLSGFGIVTAVFSAMMQTGAVEVSLQ